MSSETVQRLKKNLEALLAPLSDVLEWNWDGRFGAVLAEFSADRSEEVQALLEEHLSSCLDASQLKEASESVQQIGRKLGGLMPGQKLWLPDNEGDAFIFCAWWPWGSGQRISIRIAAYGEGLSTDEASGLTAFLRTAFKV